MGIIAKGNVIDFEQTPSGSYIARCYRMIDIGTQTGDYQGNVTFQRKVIIFWELLEDEDGDAIRMKDGRPFSVSNRYTLSVHPRAKLRKDIDSWRGQPFTDEEAGAFDITALLGAYCRLQVIHTETNGKTYSNVSNVSYTKKKPQGVNELSWWSIEDPDMEAFENFSDWLKDKIRESKEWQTKEAQKAEDEVADMLQRGDNEPINLDDLPY